MRAWFRRFTRPSSESPGSTYERAEALYAQSDFDGARAAYERAIDTGDPHYSSLSALNLGSLLEQLGNIAEARTFYRLASDSNYALYSPTAAFNLGLLAQSQGDLDDAIAAYRQAAGSGHAHYGPVCAVNLGVLLAHRGDNAGARAAYQQALDSGHPDERTKAMFNLAVLRAELGEVDDAAHAYTDVISSYHPPALCTRAWTNLRKLRADHPDNPAVVAAHQHVVDTGFADLVQGAGRARDDDIDGAISAYERVASTGHPEYEPWALILLGGLLEKVGDLEGATLAYRYAIASRHPDFLPKAAIYLGLLRKSKGEFTNARAALQQAIDSGHPDCAHLVDDIDVVLDPRATYVPAIRSRAEHESLRIRREAGVAPRQSR